MLKDKDIIIISTEIIEHKSCPRDIPVDAVSLDNDTYPSYVIKVCINDTKLISAKNYTEREKLASSCTIISNNISDLRLLRIANFLKGWYQLRDSHTYLIYLRYNNIARLTSKIFNDLPESVTEVYLSGNKTTRLEKGIIVNVHLRIIDFGYNFVIEIEDDVFINTNLIELYLNSNKLKDTKFAPILPLTLAKLYLHSNKIDEIFPESFSNLNNLRSLYPDSNNITVIHKDSLCGPSSLTYLLLERNRIQKIKAFCFRGLTELTVHILNDNEVLTLQLGVSNGPKTLERLDLEGNNITRIEKGPLKN